MKLTLQPASTGLVIVSAILAAVGFWPGLSEYLIDAGGFVPARVIAASTGDNDGGGLPVWITPFTSALIHDGLIGLLMPGLLLMFLGNLTEKILGWKAILTLYFGGAAAAAAALVLVAGNVDAPFAGSFNAISAIIGAYLILYPVGVIKTWGSFSPQASRIMQLLILWLFINIATNISVTSDVIGIFGNMRISVAPTMASFAFGLLVARPLLLWKYRNA